MGKMKVKHYRGGVYTVIGTTKPMPKGMDGTIVFVACHTEEHLRDVYVYIERLKRDIHEPLPRTNIYETQLYVKGESTNFVVYFNEKTNQIFARPEEMFWEWDYFNDKDVYEPRFSIIEGLNLGE